jgi:hypothetical protein
MITAKKQTENIIKWLDALPNYRKIHGKLGRKNAKNKWSYCCLGVGCRVMDVRKVDFSIGMEERLVPKLSMKNECGEFDMLLKVNDCLVSSLVDINDHPFAADNDFTHQRKAMLLTLDYWIKDKDVCKAVKKHFANEIRKIKKEGVITVEIL